LTEVAPEDPLRGRRALAKLQRVFVPTWWSRNFGVIFAGRVLMSVGRSLAGVAAPIYLALEGFSAFELSLYVLVVALSSAVLSTAVGLTSDRVGRRPYLVAVPLLTAGAAAGFAFSGSAPVLFVLGALGSFGRGAGAGAGAVGPYQPAESAFITEDLPAEHRNAGFGRLTFGSSAGAMAGSLLALLVSSSHAHGAAATAAFRPAFLAVASTAALAGLVATGLAERPRRDQLGRSPSDGGFPPPEATALDDPGQVPEFAGVLEPEGPPVVEGWVAAPPQLGTQGRGEVPRQRGILSFRLWLKSRLPVRSRWLLYRLLATNLLNGMAIGMFGPFITYWLFRRFGAGAGEVGTLYAVINAATMVSSLSAAGLARRWGLVRTVAVVRSAQALLLVPMVLAPSFALAGGIYFVRMLVQRIGLPLRQSYAIALAHPEERSSVAALSNAPSQLAQAASPLLTGYLFEEVSLSVPFELAAALQFANAVVFWAFFHDHPPEEERRAHLRGQAELGPAPASEASSRCHDAADPTSARSNKRPSTDPSKGLEARSG
jgi:MFS family permease